MVRYYGYYSNVARGKRKKAGEDDKIPCILEPELSDKGNNGEVHVLMRSS